MKTARKARRVAKTPKVMFWILEESDDPVMVVLAADDEMAGELGDKGDGLWKVTVTAVLVWLMTNIVTGVL